MDDVLFSTLKRVYYGRKSKHDWDAELGRPRYQQPEDVDESAWAALCEGPLPPNDIRVLRHDELIDRILAADRKLTWESVFDGFVLGCSGRWPRGRQTLISSVFARHLEPHGFENPDASDDAPCHACGLPRRAALDRTETIFRLYWGYAWNELPAGWVFDLEERGQIEEPQVTDADRAAFRDLLRAIDAAEPGETPGKLAARLGTAKLLPGTDKYRRYGILEALGEAGVLPNDLIPPTYERLASRPEVWAAHENLTTSHRSDIVLPFAGWRGELGVDWQQARALFGDWVG